MRTYVIHEGAPPLGPCPERGCGHAYCFSERRIASSICPECGTEIGVGTEFVMNGHIPAHAKCSLPTCVYCKKQILPGDEVARTIVAHKSCAARSIDLLR